MQFDPKTYPALAAVCGSLRARVTACASDEDGMASYFMESDPERVHHVHAFAHSPAFRDLDSLEAWALPRVSMAESMAWEGADGPLAAACGDRSSEGDTPCQR